TQILTDFNYYVSLDSIYAVGANSSFIIENETSDSPFAIYPNPCDEGFYVVLSQEENEEITVRISDALGRMMSNNKILTNFRTPSFISTYELPAGLYFIECITGNKHISNKLVIQRKD
ncbi:MAG: T9SS type A sorting domain-containing protein, partial [Bacteroidetes bacterium]|nr:T9SS type A sorting domain-containing protein [Bacteroidota bacterium]